MRSPGLGTTHLDVDGWGVDVIIGGSQKALMMPPGLAYCAVSERAWKRMETTTSPRFYFDLRKERKSAAKGETAYTPATSLFAALGAALEFIRGMGDGDLAKGREELVNNAELCAEMTRAGAKALGLKLYASAPAAALTAICAPDGLDSGKIVKEFRESFRCCRCQRPGRDEGTAVPHRAHWVLRLIWTQSGFSERWNMCWRASRTGTSNMARQCGQRNRCMQPVPSLPSRRVSQAKILTTKDTKFHEGNLGSSCPRE